MSFTSERDGQRDQERVEHGEAWPAGGEPDERGDARKEEQSVVPGRGDGGLRQVHAVRQIAGERAGAASHRIGDVARASGGRIDPDEQERGSGGHGGRCRGPQRRHAAHAQAEDKESCEVDDEPAAVGAYAALGDAGRDREGDQREGAQADQRSEDERGGEQERLDLVREPVKAAAAVGMRPDHGEGVPLGPGPHHCEQEGEKRGQPERERRAGPQQRRGAHSCDGSGHREHQDSDPRGGHRRGAEGDGDRDARGGDQERRAPDERRASEQRQQPEQRHQRGEHDHRRNPGGVGVVEAVVEAGELRERIVRRPRSDPRRVTSVERPNGRRHVGQRDEPGSRVELESSSPR